MIFKAISINGITWPYIKILTKYDLNRENWITFRRIVIFLDLLSLF